MTRRLTLIALSFLALVAWPLSVPAQTVTDADPVGGARDGVTERFRDAVPDIADETDRGGHEREEHPELSGGEADGDHGDEDGDPHGRTAEERRPDHATDRQVHHGFGCCESGVELGCEELVDASMGRGDIALRVPPESWSEAELHLSNLDWDDY